MNVVQTLKSPDPERERDKHRRRCPQCVTNMPTMCPQYAHNMLAICPQYVHNMPLIAQIRWIFRQENDVENATVKVNEILFLHEWR